MIYEKLKISFDSQLYPKHGGVEGLEKDLRGPTSLSWILCLTREREPAWQSGCKSIKGRKQALIGSSGSSPRPSSMFLNVYTDHIQPITPLSTQISASKFQNLSRIPLKKLTQNFENSLKILKLTQNFKHSLKILNTHSKF